MWCDNDNSKKLRRISSKIRPEYASGKRVPLVQGNFRIFFALKRHAEISWVADKHADSVIFVPPKIGLKLSFSDTKKNYYTSEN